MARIVTKISHNEAVNPDIWVLSVEDTESGAGQPIALFPCSSPNQAELFETQIGNLMTYLGGRE